MEEYTGAVRRSIDGGIYWSSEEDLEKGNSSPDSMS